MTININLNSRVKVELTPEGRVIFDKHCVDSYNRLPKGMQEDYTIEDVRKYKGMKDNELTCCLHELCNIFGQSLVLGLNSPFVNNIIKYELPD